jgi:hypothetical protein
MLCSRLYNNILDKAWKFFSFFSCVALRQKCEEEEEGRAGQCYLNSQVASEVERSKILRLGLDS